MEKKIELVRNLATAPLDVQGSISSYLGVVARHRIEPLPEPKVVKQETNLDQMVQSALARIQYGIEAECSWGVKKLKEGFKEDKRRLDTRSRIGIVPICYLSEQVSVRLLLDPIESIVELNSCDELPAEGDNKTIYIVYASKPAFFRCWNKTQYLDVTYSFPSIAFTGGTGGIPVVNAGSDPAGKFPAVFLPSYF